MTRFFDSDGDGNPTNDRDRNLTDALEFNWDLNSYVMILPDIGRLRRKYEE